jgi:hypothetical protein
LDWLILARAREDKSGCSWWVLVGFFTMIPAVIYLVRAIAEHEYMGVLYFGALLAGIIVLIRWRRS